MKYHKRIVTGAFALSLLVGGSSVRTYADSVSVQGGVSATSTRNGALHFKNLANARKKINHTVGVVTAVGATGFTFDVHHGHQATSTAVAAKILSIDVQTTGTTTIKKDGAEAALADLTVGQKVIVSGSVDSTGHMIAAKRVDIVTNSPSGIFKKKGKVNK
jgi:hypothetical protein